jgi:ribosomal protein L37E
MAARMEKPPERRSHWDRNAACKREYHIIAAQCSRDGLPRLQRHYTLDWSNAMLRAALERLFPTA